MPVERQSLRLAPSHSSHAPSPIPHRLPHTQPLLNALPQVFFYKRAQIFAADVYGAFAGRGLGAFTDVDKLSCFADYRVPVVLRHMGIMQYDEALAAKVGREG